MPVDSKLRAVLEEGEEPIAEAKESFVVGVAGSARYTYTTEDGKVHARIGKRLFGDVRVVLTDRRLLRFAEVRPTGRTNGGDALFDVDRSVLESIPIGELSKLELLRAGDQVRLKLVPLLYRSSALKLDWDSADLYDPVGLEKLVADFAAGAWSGSPERQEELLRAGIRFSELGVEEIGALRRTNAASWPVFGGFGLAGCSSLIVSCFGINILWALVGMLTRPWPRHGAPDGLMWVVVGPAIIIGAGIFGVLGFGLAATQVGRYTAAKGALDAARAGIDALRAEVAAGR